MRKRIITMLLLGVLSASALAQEGEADRRQIIWLTPAERALVLAEMRQFLQAWQGMLDALSKEDFAALARHARSMGRAAQQGVPQTLREKLPEPFMKLGGETHAAFDSIAQDAEAMEDVSLTLQQMAEQGARCVACHSAWRLEAR